MQQLRAVYPLSYSETGPGPIIEVASGLLEPTLNQALEAAARAACGHPHIRQVSMELRKAGRAAVEVSSHPGEPPAPSALLPVDPVLVTGGEEAWVIVPLARGDVAGRLAAKLAPDCAGVDAECVATFLKEIGLLVARRLDVQSLFTEIRESQGLTDLLSTLSHDLRTPLASIMGYGTLMMANSDQPWDIQRQQEFSSIIVEECNHIERLIASLLDSTTDEEAFLPAKELVLVPPLLKSLLRERAFSTCGHRIVVDIAADAREVYGDPVRIEQLFRNLVDNAVKYSSEGSLIVIRARRTNGDISFSVADQGHGIAPEHMNRLFERFYRIKSVSSKHIGGTGLGLPIVRRIVESHGGHIWAESAVGKGTTFHFRLPAPSLGEEENQ